MAETPYWLAPEAALVAGLAVMVTAILGRGRLGLLLLLMLAWQSGPSAGHDAGALACALGIAVVAAFPEPRWRSLHAWLVCALAIALLVFPASVLDDPALAAPAIPESAAQWCLGLATLTGLGRWVRHGAPFDLVFALSLILATAVLWAPTALRFQFMAALAAGVVLGCLWAARRVAYADALTGLPNRRAFDERLARLSAQAAIAMIDVDHFKRFNDRHGHAAGDLALRAVARVLRRVRGGTAFRYGGEEFAVVFEGRTTDQAENALEQIRQDVERAPVRMGTVPGNRAQAVRRGAGGEVRVTVSMGLAVRAGRKHSPEDLMRDADKALYRAKQAGRNRLMRARS